LGWPVLPDGAVSAAVKAIHALRHGLFHLVFPDDCRVCGEPLREVSRIPVCARCLESTEPISAEHFCIACRTPFLNRFPLDESGRCALCRLGLAGFDEVYSFGWYQGALRTLIHLFKYSGVRPLARVFGRYLKRALPVDLRFDVVVPMPLHWRRRWHRGFNQAALLAEEVARRFGVPVSKVVRRSRVTPSQAGLTHARRRANVRGAFKVKRGTRLNGLRVLLIDDVLTTGATAAACARELKRAGAAHVTVLALARTDRRELLSYQPDATAAQAGLPDSTPSTLAAAAAGNNLFRSVNSRSLN
jgi:ComF family protein